MNIKTLTDMELTKIIGGKKKRNSWQQNVIGAIGSAAAGASLGGAICSVPCAILGAHYGAIAWTAGTGLSGGFGHIR